MRTLAAILFAAVTLAAVVGVNRADAATLDSLATEVVGSPVTVACFPVSADDEWSGFVLLPDPVIYLSGPKCGALLNVLHPGTRTARWLRSFDGQQDVGYAYLTLVHEATHLIEYHGPDARLAYDEGLTECTAFRNAWNATRLLGLTWKLRRAVYLAITHSHYGKSPLGPYRTVC